MNAARAIPFIAVQGVAAVVAAAFVSLRIEAGLTLESTDAVFFLQELAKPAKPPAPRISTSIIMDVFILL